MIRDVAGRDVEVAEIETIAARVKQFRLVSRLGTPPLPAFSPGAHIVVTMSDDTRTIRNAYSLTGSVHDASSYRISVLHVGNSRGGSRFLHEQVTAGSVLRISGPVNLFPMHILARKHLLIAGGIGITPFLPMMQQMSGYGRPFELHYSVPDAQRGAYCSELLERYPQQVRCYWTRTPGKDGERIPVQDLLQRQPLGTHLYVCGPSRLIESVLDHARLFGWPETSVHAEHFSPVGSYAWKPFDVELTRSKKTVHVRQEETLLEALESAGVEAPYLCRGGACGQCETSVLACEATLLHNDHYLSEEERAGGKKIMICVSRAKAGTLILDL